MQFDCLNTCAKVNSLRETVVVWAFRIGSGDRTVWSRNMDWMIILMISTDGQHFTNSGLKLSMDLRWITIKSISKQLHTIAPPPMFELMDFAVDWFAAEGSYFTLWLVDPLSLFKVRWLMLTVSLGSKREVSMGRGPQRYRIIQVSSRIPNLPQQKEWSFLLLAWVFIKLIAWTLSGAREYLGYFLSRGHDCIKLPEPWMCMRSETWWMPSTWLLFPLIPDV